MTNNQEKPSLIDQFKNRSRPRKPWLLMVAGALLVACFIVVFAFYQMGTDPAVSGKAKTRAMRDDVKSTPGGDASPEYRKKIEELNKQEADSAKKEGQSFVPSVAGQMSDEDSLGENSLDNADDAAASGENQNPGADDQRGPKEEKANAQVRAMEKRMRQMQERMQALQQRQQPRGQGQYQGDTSDQEYSRQYGKQIAQISTEMEEVYTNQKIVVFEDKSDTGESAADKQDLTAGTALNGSGSGDGQPEQAAGSGPDLKAGDVLYAKNEVLLNSDAAGPAQATVLSGKFQGAKLLGGFDKSNNYLRVRFNRMILPEGAEYKVEAVAIDPEVSATAVRSDVNRHILSRWGGLMAASFVAGLGEAMQDSGTDIAVSDGTTISSTPDLNTEEQLWTAAGRVGEELSSVLSKNFDRPSTVKLAPGINIGVLFLAVEKKED